MPDALQQAGALSEPSNFAPLHTNRIFTGLWSNRNPLRDAATNEYQERYGMGRQDSILDGENSEISPRLTLRRRYGSSVYNANSLPPVNRFYSFNTFTISDEFIRVMADTATDVRDITDGGNAVIFTKSAGAQSTYFLGVGNTLYMANGMDNRQWVYDPTTHTGQIWNWGIQPPANAPVATQQPRPSSYPGWAARTVHTAYVDITPPGQAYPRYFNACIIQDGNGNLQFWGTNSGPIITQDTLGPSEPVWLTGIGQFTTDGTATWQNIGPSAWVQNYSYTRGAVICVTPTGQPTLPMQIFIAITQGDSNNGNPPVWPAVLGQQVADGQTGLVWQNIGPVIHWSDIGGGQPPAVTITTLSQIVDPNGYLQTVHQQGRTADTVPAFSNQVAGLTLDNNMQWQNSGPFAVPGTAPVQYGYAFMNSRTGDIRDISNMSPASNAITIIGGNEVIVKGDGSTDPQVDTIILYRTAQGGSTFLQLATFPNPPVGQQWTYTDNSPDSELNVSLQAQRNGEGTPLPSGATALGFHLGKIFAAVGNVVWISSGPDAVVSGSSGNAGFNTFFTCQSKITRFWTCPLGMIVFTVRDAYVILGSATDTDPLYMVVYIEDLPLRSYDCFTVNKTTPYMLLGNNTLLSLDPSAGIVEVGFPIADLLLEEFDSGIPTGQQRSGSFVTFHKESSLDTALYVANGQDHWYRMAAVNAPETGSSWSPKAHFGNLGCVQSVEVKPGQYRLLMSGTSPGPILQRDGTKNTDNGQTFPVTTQFGIVVLALPGQLAVLSFLTLESIKVGSRAVLELLLGELEGEFEQLKRTRQDPPILPPSDTIFSDRYHFAQSQKEAWCRHFQMTISWPAEDAANELLTFTIFGQRWQETRSQ